MSEKICDKLANLLAMAPGHPFQDRDAWEKLARSFEKRGDTMSNGTKIITLCGSSRFVDIMAVCAWFLERDEKAITMGLHLLPEWYCKNEIPDHLAEHEGCAAEMDELHLHKINLSQEIFVVNYEDYIGSSTRKEIEYAMATGKPIRWFTHDPVGEKVRRLIMSITP